MRDLAAHHNPPSVVGFIRHAILRKARCRTRDLLWATVGASLPRFEPAECRNCFRHCGYSAATGL